MADISACLTSNSDLWETPVDFYNQLNDKYHFTLDAAANQLNHKCDFYYGPGGVVEDALTVNAVNGSWPVNDIIWCNPPYSKGLQIEFVKRAHATMVKGGCVVMLLPSRTDTKVFHNYIWLREMNRARQGVTVDFIKGRLKFVGAAASAPFPSMVVEFRL